MPGLLRAAAATAVVAGTAQATRNAVNRHSAEKNAVAYQHAMDSAQAQSAPPPQQSYAPPPQAYAPPPPAPAPAPAGTDVTSQLNQLAQLHASGVLTDEEFAAAKQKVLAGG